MKSTSLSRGFTLIELLVVIAIIGILSSVVLASLSTARMKSRDARRIADIGQLRTAVEMFNDSVGSYPTSSNGTTFDSINSATTGKPINNLTPSYIAKLPNDPNSGWNYQYYGSSTANRYIIAAQLEDRNNNALKTDGDVVLGGIDGNSLNCIGASSGTDGCYDTGS